MIISGRAYAIVVLAGFFLSCSSSPIVRTTDDQFLRDGQPYTGHVDFSDEKGTRIVGEALNGQKNGLWTTYYPNGTRWEQYEYSLGMRHGTSRFWDEHGRLRIEGSFRADKLNGTIVGYHQNGSKAYVEEFRAGKRSGHWIEWDSLGIQTSSYNYDSDPTPPKRVLKESFVRIDTSETWYQMIGLYYKYALRTPTGWYVNDSSGIDMGLPVIYLLNGQRWSGSTVSMSVTTSIGSEPLSELMDSRLREISADSLESPSFELVSIERTLDPLLPGVLVRTRNVAQERLRAFIPLADYTVVFDYSAYSTIDFNRYQSSFISVVQSLTPMDE